jgi:hypothetical protein
MEETTWKLQEKCCYNSSIYLCLFVSANEYLFQVQKSYGGPSPAECCGEDRFANLEQAQRRFAEVKAMFEQAKVDRLASNTAFQRYMAILKNLYGYRYVSVTGRLI